MAIISGFRTLVTNVQSYFATNGVTANVVAGWKEPGKQVNQGPGGANRVVFQPSLDNGDGGVIKGGAQPGPRVQGDGSSVRTLRNWDRDVIVSIWAVDTSNTADELLQIDATENLFEWTVRAVNAALSANAVWGKVTWTVPPVELGFGREIRVVLTLRTPLFATPIGVAFPAPVITKELEV